MSPEPKAGRSLRFPALSLRSKGVAALAVPMAALFVALFSIYMMEKNASQSALEMVQAYETRKELLQTDIGLLDAVSAISAYLVSADAGQLAKYDAARARVQESL